MEPPIPCGSVRLRCSHGWGLQDLMEERDESSGADSLRAIFDWAANAGWGGTIRSQCVIAEMQVTG